MNPKVDTYLNRAETWQEELKRLQTILLDCGLSEDLKWGAPCYAYRKTNIAIIGGFKECCVLSFFKGVLLEDPDQILSKPGENTQSARLIRFTDVRQIDKMEPVLKAYIYEALEVEKAGLTVKFNSRSASATPAELQAKLDESPRLNAAFKALTPGRQRAYLLHISAPKQSKTRVSRVQACIPKILQGLGLTDLNQRAQK